MSFNGYANTYPNSNVNNNFANPSGSENIGIFPTNDTGHYLGFNGSRTCPMSAKGGKRHIKTKIKNISKMYKMRKNKTQIRGLKRQIMSRYRLKRKNKNKTKKNYKRGGGQSGQFQNNLPVNQSYSLGGVLDAKNSALANPPPHEVVSGKWAIMDNFNKFTGLGFASKGH
jgi:hypothetical protein